MRTNLFILPKKISDKWVMLLIFLFPIAGPVIRDWNSLLYFFITFTSLYFLFTKRNRKPLHKEEKVYLWVFFLFFCVYIASVLVNGYSLKKILDEGLGTEINYLFFFPVYLLIREYDFSKKMLFAGILISIPIIFIFSLYEYIFILPNTRTPLIGAYSQLFLGPITALSLLMSYPAYKAWFRNKQYYWFIPIYVSMGLLVIILTEARIAYLVIISGSFVLLLLIPSRTKNKLISLVLLFFIVISAYQINIVKYRTNLAIDNFINYFMTIDKVNVDTDTSLGLRLEVWRSAQYVFKEHPIVGIGNGNYPNYIQKYIDNGLVGQKVSAMGHAHNTFIEALITKGIIGLILLLMIFYYPLYISWKNRKLYYNQFLVISIFVVSITTMSLGEAMLINKNNGVSYLLLFSAILFSSAIREIKGSKNNN